MIGKVLICLLVSFLRGAISQLGSCVDIPLSYIATLTNVTSYGNYIVGMDLLGIFAGLVLFWTGVKLAIGVVLFLWRLLPLT